jgi:hypothetical protein
VVTFKRVTKAFALLLICGFICACSEEDDPLAPQVVLSGTVINVSGVEGAVIVEIDNNLRDVADVQGHFTILVQKDLLVDSLYAWVDENANAFFDAGEPHGAYPNSFHVGNSNIGNLDFVIP